MINSNDKEFKILENFKLSKPQVIKISDYINLLDTHNKVSNLVGKSTMLNPIKSHILDSIQISKVITEKNSRIIDMGTGAGLPGIVLSIFGYKNLFLVDSNGKKTRFLEQVTRRLNLSCKIINSRIENLKEKNFDYVVSRALASLERLLFYSSFLSNKKTKLIFLKGQKVKEEIINAKKKWVFDYKLRKSLSDRRGSVLLISNFKRKLWLK